jgi:cytochrome c biogenesis protein CcdA
LPKLDILLLKDFAKQLHSMAAEITLAAAFLAGILSFASPCVLPLLPGFLIYISGIGLKASEKASRARIFLNAFAYVLGFTFVFSLLGIVLNNLLGASANGARTLLGQIGGTIIVLFGLHLLGFINLDFINKEYRANPALMDLQNIATHELGHAFGMDDIYTDACSSVTMYGYSDNGDISKRTLEQPDITGLRLMYGQ